MKASKPTSLHLLNVLRGSESGNLERLPGKAPSFPACAPPVTEYAPPSIQRRGSRKTSNSYLGQSSTSPYKPNFWAEDIQAWQWFILSIEDKCQKSISNWTQKMVFREWIDLSDHIFNYLCCFLRLYFAFCLLFVRLLSVCSLHWDSPSDQISQNQIL